MSVIYDNELQLPGIEIISKSEEDGVVDYDIGILTAPEKCPDCGSKQLSKFGKFTRTL